MSIDFSLIFSHEQEEIVAKFVWLGQKLGLVQRPRTDNDDDGKVGADVTGDVKEKTASKTAPAIRPVSTFNPPTNVGQLASPYGTNPATMFPAPTKQPAVYHHGSGLPYHSGNDKRNNALNSGQDSPLTKRAAMAKAAAPQKHH